MLKLLAKKVSYTLKDALEVILAAALDSNRAEDKFIPYLTVANNQSSIRSQFLHEPFVVRSQIRVIPGMEFFILKRPGRRGGADSPGMEIGVNDDAQMPE